MSTFWSVYALSDKALFQGQRKSYLRILDSLISHDLRLYLSSIIFWSIQSLDFNFLGGHFLSKIHWIGPQFFLDLEFRSPQDVEIVLILALTGLRFSSDRFTVTLKGSIRTWYISHARRERPKRISDAFYRWTRRRHNVFSIEWKNWKRLFSKRQKDVILIF